MAWASDKRQRTLLESIENLIELSPEFMVIGLSMMSDFVEQMNLPHTSTFTAKLSSLVDNTEHRKTATQFVRDSLPDIFQYALSVLREIHDNNQEFQNSGHRQAVLENIFKILSRCLSFDFNGCTIDEGSDEIWVLQVPSSWEGLICRSEQLTILFDM